MPHRGICRPQKSMTKFLTVFNTSTLTTNGKSLNSIQYNDRVVQDDLFSLPSSLPVFSIQGSLQVLLIQDMALFSSSLDPGQPSQVPSIQDCPLKFPRSRAVLSSSLDPG
ncbi:hypothetical protein TNCV_3328631 [Trichonephila clavipes]|nr:hypothetical protein TNCV_3328631 [Trichonephila clavipes]